MLYTCKQVVNASLVRNNQNNNNTNNRKNKNKTVIATNFGKANGIM